MKTHLKLVKPRNYTSAEEVLDAVREAIYVDGRPYRVLGNAAGVSLSTVYNIATGKTTWPRHTTLFPLMHVLGIRMEVILPERKQL
jgi:hypothetical protein